MTTLYSATYNTPSGKVVAITEDSKHGFSVSVDGNSLGCGFFSLCTHNVGGVEMDCVKVYKTIVPVPADLAEGLKAAVAARDAWVAESAASAARYDAQHARTMRGMDA